MNERDIILFVGGFPEKAEETVRALEKKLGRKLRLACIYHAKERAEKARKEPDLRIRIYCESEDPLKIAQALFPYQEKFLLAVCRGEKHIPFFAEVIPNIPYVRTPSSEALEWASDKIAMRRRLRAYDKNIAPRFAVVTDATRATLKTIKEKVGFPLVLKPAGLAASLLVTVCYHEEELGAALRMMVRKIKKIYQDNKRTAEPKILVEEFMDGDMYSIDAYVSPRGAVYCCPPVHIKTGEKIGFDDFFGYRQMTPTLLKKDSIALAEEAVKKAVRALCLSGTTAHVELMRTEEGFKIIELGARVGGFRHALYERAYGINHALNDLLIRIPKKVSIPKKPKGYAAALKLFAKKEGTLTSIQGLKKVRSLKSVVLVTVNKKVGDKCAFSKNGGHSIANIILFNKVRSELLADIRRLEKSVVFVTE